jgi:hypothetical protein
VERYERLRDMEEGVKRRTAEAQNYVQTLQTIHDRTFSAHAIVKRNVRNTFFLEFNFLGECRGCMFFFFSC